MIVSGSADLPLPSLSSQSASVLPCHLWFTTGAQGHCCGLSWWAGVHAEAHPRLCANGRSGARRKAGRMMRLSGCSPAHDSATALQLPNVQQSWRLLCRSFSVCYAQVRDMMFAPYRRAHASCIWSFQCTLSCTLHTSVQCHAACSSQNAHVQTDALGRKGVDAVLCVTPDSPEAVAALAAQPALISPKVGVAAGWLAGWLAG
jgi:hypothetical protein